MFCLSLLSSQISLKNQVSDQQITVSPVLFASTGSSFWDILTFPMPGTRVWGQFQASNVYFCLITSRHARHAKKMSRVCTFCVLLLCLMDGISARVIDEGRTKGKTWTGFSADEDCDTRGRQIPSLSLGVCVVPTNVPEQSMLRKCVFVPKTHL